MNRDASVLLVGGCGGVYFLADPGELTVEVVKRDRNRRTITTDLRAILAGPDRQVLHDTTILDDGRAANSGLGPAASVRLTTTVPSRGVYVLNVTVSQDRYGQEVLWGFRTNCPRYLVETARGHRDERHQEPVVLGSPERAADVCFLPRPAAAMALEVTGLPADVDAVTVADARGAPVASFPVGTDRRAAGSLPAAGHRDALPWRLHLPKADATVNLDGLTRWDPVDPYPDLCVWSPEPSSWFPLLENRWLLTPYSRTVYGEPDGQAEVRLQVHNDSGRERTVRLELEFPADTWPATLAASQLTVAPHQAASAVLRVTAPAAGQERRCRVRAAPTDDAGFSTWSTVTVRGGPAPAAAPLTLPLTLKPYQHENEQFGCLPDYPVDSELYTNAANRPFVRLGGDLASRRDRTWETIPLAKALTSPPAAFAQATLGFPTSKIAFDQADGVYLLATAGRSAALLASADGGRHFAVAGVPGASGAFDLANFSGHNPLAGPPPFVRYVQTAKDPKRIWRRMHDLDLFVPRRVGDRVEVGDPIPISKLCIGLAAHSGAPAAVVARGPKVHVAWAEATDPDVRVPGVPTYVVTYDQDTRTLGQPALIGYGPPPNDIHNSPSITMDSQGYLHVLVGTHGRPFQYARSLQPNDAGAGWTPAEPPGSDLNQTYVGLVCGADDALHATFRLWRSGEPFPHSTHATLAYQRKRPGQPWEPPTVLVVAPFSEYSVFYHRLTIDRKGRLLLSYDYWSTYWFYRNDHYGRRRVTLLSPDGGGTWKLLSSSDFD